MSTAPRSAIFKLRLHDEELHAWQEAAWRRHQSVSELVRRSVAAELESLPTADLPNPAAGLEAALAELGIEV